MIYLSVASVVATIKQNGNFLIHLLYLSQFEFTVIAVVQGSAEALSTRS